MTQEFRLFFWVVVGLALVVSGAWAAWRLFFGKPKTAPDPPAIAAGTGGAELLHVERAAGGQLRIRLKGHQIEGAEEIGDPTLRTAVHMLVSALGAETAAPVADAAAPPIASSPISSDIELRRPLVERVRESLAKPQAYAPARGEVKASTPAAAEAPWTFAGINEIVERLRRNAPNMPEIELSGEGAEIRVWFDGQAYRSVDDVPDERARALIREAVTQWERE